MAIPSSYLASYQAKFNQYQNGGFILGRDAPAIFAPFQLPKAELFQIWTLADTAKQGRIGFAAFARACHMAHLASKKEPYLAVELPSEEEIAAMRDLPARTSTSSTNSVPTTPTAAAAAAAAAKTTDGDDSDSGEEVGEEGEGDDEEDEEDPAQIHVDEEAEAKAKAERKAAKAEWKAKRKEEQDAQAREEYEARLRRIEQDLAASSFVGGGGIGQQQPSPTGAPKPRKLGRGSIRQGKSFKSTKPSENFLAPRATAVPANTSSSDATTTAATSSTNAEGEHTFGPEHKTAADCETKIPAVERKEASENAVATATAISNELAPVKISPWTLTKADLFNYKTLFSKYSTAGAVLAKNAPALFTPFGLDQNTMRDIWIMADVGKKGKLTSFEFIVAMHLVTCIAQRGAKMPSVPPFELTNECILAVVNGKPLPPPGMSIFRRMSKEKVLRKRAHKLLLMRVLRDLENAEVHDLALYHSQLREKYLLSLKETPFNQAANIQARLQARIATIGASLAERPWRPVSIPLLKDDDVITLPFVQSMLAAFRRGEFLSYENAWQILKRISTVLTQEKTVQYTTIEPSSRMVVVGDLHGQLDDFMYVLHNSGLPSENNHILFNGDFVDRGNNSCEVVFSIFALKLACPHWVFLNRGNHEAAEINEANGFTVECTKKYDRDLFNLFSDTFACLPLAHVLNNKIFVVHGGLSWQDFKVADLNNVNRFIVDPVYGTLMSDLLWSDPDQKPGRADSRRGTGCHFGPDIVKNFLTANNLDIIIRSHEVCDGVEYWFDGSLITVFSASNYCGDTGNIGGFLVVDPNLNVTTTTYQEDQLLTEEQKANKSKHTSIDLSKCVRTKLRDLILENKQQLETELAKFNEEGLVNISQWSGVLQKVLAVRTPFALLASQWGFRKGEAMHYNDVLARMTN